MTAVRFGCSTSTNEEKGEGKGSVIFRVKSVIFLAFTLIVYLGALGFLFLSDDW